MALLSCRLAVSRQTIKDGYANPANTHMSSPEIVNFTSKILDKSGLCDSTFVSQGALLLHPASRQHSLHVCRSCQPLPCRGPQHALH